MVPQVVPYPLPLESPPVLIDWNERRFRVIADESPVETTVRIYLCRDRLETLTAVLKPELPCRPRRPKTLVAHCRDTTGAHVAERRSRSDFDRNGVNTMLDLFYIAVCCLVLVGLLGPSQKPATSL